MNKLVIELGGKERTLKFNMIFLEEYDKKKRENGNAISNTAVMIWAGIKAHSEITETPMDCTFEDCYDWAEEMIFNNDVDKINSIGEAFLNSTVFKGIEDAKKKLQQEEQTLTELGLTPLEKSA